MKQQPRPFSWQGIVLLVAMVLNFFASMGILIAAEDIPRETLPWSGIIACTLIVLSLLSYYFYQYKKVPSAKLCFQLSPETSQRLKILADLKDLEPEAVVSNALALYEWIAREQAIDSDIEIWTMANGEPLQKIVSQ